MRRATTIVLAALALAWWGRPAPLAAQIAPLTYELRLGGTVPVGDLTDPGASWVGEVGEGFSFGMDFAYAFRWYAAAYAGFSQHRLRCSAERCGRASDLAATGFDAGVRWIFGSGRVIPLLRTGVVTYRVEAAAPDGDGGARSVTSRRAVGVEGGPALSVRLGPRLVVSPGVRYVRISPGFPGLGDYPMQAVVADLGFLLAF